jgi:protein-S-isoprenylcysteine O-methyltransferase Ste14
MVEKIGKFLFRWRGYLPLILLAIFYKVFVSPENVELKLGELWGHLFEVFCLSVSVTGLIVRVLIRGQVPEETSSRSTKRLKAKTLNTTGFYSIVRHPIYVLGNFPIFLGILLFTQIWWIALIGVVLFWVYYLPIMKAEEKFLEQKFGETWKRWAKITPFLFPNFKNWQPSSVAFSWKKAFRKESSTLFVILTTYSLIDSLRDYFIEKNLDLFWIVVLITGSCFYLSVKIRKENKFLFSKKN